MMTDSDRMDVFRGMAHPFRRRVLKELQKGGRTVTDLCAHFGVTPPMISQHLAVLRETGLVTQRLEGRRRVYHYAPSTMKRAARWIGQF